VLKFNVNEKNTFCSNKDRRRGISTSIRSLEGGSDSYHRKVVCHRRHSSHTRTPCAGFPFSLETSS